MQKIKYKSLVDKKYETWEDGTIANPDDEPIMRPIVWNNIDATLEFRGNPLSHFEDFEIIGNIHDKQEQG